MTKDTSQELMQLLSDGDSIEQITKFISDHSDELDFSWQNEKGDNALALAVKRNDTTLVELLLGSVKEKFIVTILT